MPSAADRLEFGPPRDAGAARSFGFALLVHGLLILALTWGVSWKRSDQSVAFEAEIWSSLPQAAAPKLVEPPPAPPPPRPEPAPRAAEVKAAPPEPDVDIALAQEKKRKQLVQQQQQEREAQKAIDRQKAEVLAKKKIEKDKEKEKEKNLREDQAKKLAAQQEAKKLEDQKLAKQRDADKQAQALTARQREEALKRMMGLAGATGSPDSTGTGQKSSGPSASYGGRVRAKVKPNVVFTDEIAGNPTAEVEVRTTSDGTIISQKLVKSSGNKAWDDAVIKAIVRTETMPRDVDGRVPTPMILEFRPKD